MASRIGAIGLLAPLAEVAIAEIPDGCLLQRGTCTQQRDRVWKGELAFTGHLHFWAGERWRIWVTDKPSAAGPTLLAVEVCGSVTAAEP
ncbi:MAG TPA: hypothetical protein VGO18_11845 [Steroidobacteraceae bacterium]|nr:hypothetical protein [Steroidobacteraceae bacterium]